MAGEKDSKTQLAELMYTDPEMKPLMDDWAEKNFAGTRARMETAKAVADAKAELAKDVQAFRVEQETTRAVAARERNIALIKRDPNLRFRDDEIEGLEKFMHERGIGNYEDAAYRYRQIHQVASPQTSRQALQTVEIPGRDDDNDGSWLKSAFTPRGVNMSLADKLTKKRVNTIMDDFAKDPIGAAQRWGA